MAALVGVYVELETPGFKISSKNVIMTRKTSLMRMFGHKWLGIFLSVDYHEPLCLVAQSKN